MPLMDGPTFYQRVADCIPETLERIVFVTGAVDAKTHAFLDAVPNRYVGKPCSNEDLAAAIREVVTATSSSAALCDRNQDSTLAQS
jgi:DNA-binding NarL/FixJ family response regulator